MIQQVQALAHQLRDQFTGRALIEVRRQGMGAANRCGHHSSGGVGSETRVMDLHPLQELASEIVVIPGSAENSCYSEIPRTGRADLYSFRLLETSKEIQHFTMNKTISAT